MRKLKKWYLVGRLLCPHSLLSITGFHSAVISAAVHCLCVHQNATLYILYASHPVCCKQHCVKQLHIPHQPLGPDLKLSTSVVTEKLLLLATREVMAQETRIRHSADHRCARNDQLSPHRSTLQFQHVQLLQIG